MSDQDDKNSVTGATSLVSATASRRALLGGGGAVCLAVLLAACGDEAPMSTSKPMPDGTPNRPGDDGDVEPTASATPGPSPSSGQELAKVADVPDGSGLLVGTILLVKQDDGTVTAYDAHCTHVTTNLVGLPSDGKIVCPFHGSTFNAKDGTLVNGPAERPLTSIPVKIENGAVILV